MAHTTVYDATSSAMVQGPNPGGEATIYRYGDGVAAIITNGWRVFVTADGVMVRRIDPTERLCMKTVTPDDDDLTDVIGEAISVTVGQTKRVWPRSATPFILGDREMSWGKVED